MRRRAAGVAVVLLLAVASPAVGQVLDLSGVWQPRFHEDQPERLAGPALGDYLGLPITEGARRWAESWDPSRLTMPEHQCQVHVAPYIFFGPLNLRIWEEKDPRTQQPIAIKQYISTYEQTRTIWMDGRAHPSSNSAHTWMGFSTGRWQGDALVVETTHIKQGWIRRNGVPMSDRATLREYFIRHGNVLTRVAITTDPVYLTEPLVKTQNFVLNPRELPEQNWLWVCQPVVEIADRPFSVVPAYPPGGNPFLREFRDLAGLPESATRGGAETAYPEFARRLRQEGR
ncbi:MAG: hypothetical protein AB7P99_09890 [Vicinamibacterales bacterium]